MNFIDNLDDSSPVLIAGPTASGKSALALDIARRKGGMIVNADALQVWSCWRVLTARPDSDEQALVPHRLYGHRAIDDPYSAGHWLREVRALLSESDMRPIFVGGTGLYLTMLTQGMAEIPPTPPDIRHRADARLIAEGSDALLAELDAETRARIDGRNPARVQRAWEVQQTTGRGLADWQNHTPPPLLPLSSCRAVVIEADRDWLGRRIDARFDRMIAAGALDEVRAVLPRWDAGALWAQAIGAPELVAHLRGELLLEAAVGAAKIATRQYAKRQRTWLRNRMASWTRISLP